MSARDVRERNHILAALSEAVFRRLLPHLKSVQLALGTILIPRRVTSRYVYFPTTSIVSASYGVERGVMAEAWPVGNEGIVGILAFLGGSVGDKQAEVEIAGQAFQLDARTLSAEFERSTDLQKILLRYLVALTTQASQLAVCGHYHSIEQRLCRYLLGTFDRMPANTLDITQMQIAQLLGTRRVGITTAARRLRNAGIIDYKRGQISLLKHRELEARSCMCYSVIRDAFKELRRNPKHR